jgi:hypothetical protein
MNFIGVDNQQHRPYVVHRALLGSLERFFGMLIEHYAGAFPIWLAPVQAKVLSITDKQLDFAKGCRTRCWPRGSAELNTRNERDRIQDSRSVDGKSRISSWSDKRSSRMRSPSMNAAEGPRRDAGCGLSVRRLN